MTPIKVDQVWHDLKRKGRFVKIISVNDNTVSVRTCGANGEMLMAKRTTNRKARFAEGARSYALHKDIEA